VETSQRASELENHGKERDLIFKAFVPMFLLRSSLYILKCGLVSIGKLTYHRICTS